VPLQHSPPQNAFVPMSPAGPWHCVRRESSLARCKHAAMSHQHRRVVASACSSLQ
jgi:hypothetical protein